MRKIGAFVSVVVVLATVVACGNGDVGESCDEEGRVGGECVAEAVCGKAESQSAGSLVCLKQCTNPGDCGAGEECNGVNGTNLKGCRPKKP